MQSSTRTASNFFGVLTGDRHANPVRGNPYLVLGCQAGVTTMRDPLDFLYAGVWRQSVSFIAGSLLLLLLLLLVLACVLGRMAS